MGNVLQMMSSVFKLRISVFIMITALMGLAVTPGPKPSLLHILILAICVLGSSAAAGAYNQYAERDTDALMKRTQNRPFVTGAFQAGPLWLLSIGGLLAASVAIAAMAFNLWVAVYLFLGAFFYCIVYTIWLKRRTSMNIVVGGMSGSFAVLAGAAVVDPGAVVPLLLAAVLFLWTPPHFWSLASALGEDYKKAGIPMLPMVIGEAKCAWVILGHTSLLVGLSLVPFFYGLGPVYLAFAALGGGYFMWRSVEHVRTPNTTTAMRNFFASLIQLSALFVGVFLDAWLPF